MRFYRNGRRLQARTGAGEFRKLTGDDVGIGVCPHCRSLTVQPPEPESFRGGMIAPEAFRAWRDARVCSRCGWANEAAQRVDADLPVILDLLRRSEPADFVKLVRRVQVVGRFSLLLGAAGVRVDGNTGTSATRKLGDFCGVLFPGRRDEFLAAFFESINSEGQP